MTDVALHAQAGTGTIGVRPRLDGGLNPGTAIIFLLLLAGGLLFVGYSLYSDIAESGTKTTTFLPYLLLFVALLIALGFEFVNGFHDTANAVATVIYTHSLPAEIAVMWSGSFNFLGVLLSSGAVAFGIISLLPVELILQVGSAAGFAMVFALLIAAIIWNLGTWYLGLPASSSHTLIGSIIGVGVANALIHGQDGTSGVDWGQATNVGKALLFSPVVGFVLSAVLLLVMKVLIRQPELYRSPETDKPPAWWIRGLLVFTCTAVSFAHGSNDGQKGMGLIMLILIGTVPTAFALNRAMPDSQIAQFEANSAAAAKIVEEKAAGYNILGDPRPAVMEYVAHHKINEGTYPSLAVLIQDIDKEVKQYGSIAKIPAAAVGNTRNDMYLADEALRNLMKDKDSELSTEEVASLNAYKQSLDNSTKFIPIWVKIAVAIALGLGTMVGWKRIVITVGEKIGKTHLTYGQGAAAELVAAVTIAGADMYGLPVSTTHILSSGVAGTMAANGSGLQLSTLRNIVMAWILTLPVAMMLSGGLYVLFVHLFSKAANMRAIDVMVRDVVTVHPDTDVAEAVKLLADHDVSALPVLDTEGNLLGVLSEADLIHRTEIGTEKRRPWWLEAVTGASTLAEEFAKSHGKKVGEVMTDGVISVTEETPLSEIAALFERKRIKRVPVVKDGKLVGIVSRSNLIQALASVVGRIDEHDETDRQIRLELLSRLQEQSWTDFGSRNITVSDRVVHLWGLVGSEAERKALLALAEGVPGVSRVSDEMIPAY